MDQWFVSGSSSSSAVASTVGPLKGAESRKKKRKSVERKPAKKTHDCSECNKSFSGRTDLIRHLRVHTGEKRFGCEICLKSFSVKSTLVVHNRKHTGEKPFHCDLCPMKFAATGQLKCHRKRIHFPEQVPKLPCPECARTFKSKQGLHYHQLIHQGRKPHACFFCPKKFRHRSGLLVHLRRHLKEKSYFCKDCDKSYFSKEMLKVHRSGHTGNKGLVRNFPYGFFQRTIFP